MPHSFSYAVSMNLEHSIKEGSHERYPDHFQCFRNKKIKYPDFQAMTYRSIHEKFLRAIDHMEFHPTLGRPKEKPGVRLKRQLQGRSRQIQTLNQIKEMTEEDVEMVEKTDEWLSMQY